MKTSELIDKLALELKPVKRVSFVGWYFPWFIVSILNCGAFISYWGISGQAWNSKLNDWKSLVEAVLLLACFSTASLSLYFASIPAHPYFLIFKRLFFAISLAWLASLSFLAVLELEAGLNSAEFLSGQECFWAVLLMTALPILALVSQTRKLYCVHENLASCLVAFVPLSLSSWIFQFHCSDTTALHSIAWHYSPLLVVIPLMFVFSKKMFKKSS